MPVELGFILERLAEMAEADESLREQQPWKAAYEQDYAWLGGVITKHYAGDDSDVKVLMGGILQAFAGQTVEEYAEAAAAFLADAPHPTLGRRLRECAYVPMVELLRYLEAPRLHVLHRLGRQPRLHAGDHERALRHPARARDRQLQRAPLHRRRGRRRAHVPGGAGRVRRRPRQAGADLEPDRAAADPRRRQLERRRPDARFRGGRRRSGCSCSTTTPSASSTTSPGAEQSLERAKSDGWTVVSVKDDWGTVFEEVGDG